MKSRERIIRKMFMFMSAVLFFKIFGYELTLIWLISNLVAEVSLIKEREDEQAKRR